MQDNLRKGPWFEEEDEQLTTIIGLLGERRWDALAKTSGLRRSGKSCRLRWMNYLRPNLKHGQICEEEEQIIAQLHQQWGNKWSRIARRLPGRTDNEIKNYWRSHLRKKLQVQEQENFGSALNSGEQNLSLSVSYCEGITQRAKGDCTSEKHEISGSSVDSSDAFELLNFAFPNSPYETRVSDWISCLQSDKKHRVDYCSVGSCFCYLAGMSGQVETSMWDCSSSIWNMD